MSIRPIDLQVMIPKTSEVSKIQHTDMNKAGLEQQQFAEQLNKQTLQNQQQVSQTDKSDKTLIKDEQDKKKKNKNAKKSKKKIDSKTEEKDDKKNLSSTSIFDIKI